MIEVRQTELSFVVMTDEFPAGSREQPCRKKVRGSARLWSQMQGGYCRAVSLSLGRSMGRRQAGMPGRPQSSAM